MSDTNDASVPSPAGDGPGSTLLRDLGSRLPDRRHRNRWVPFVTGWFCLLIGLADIVHVVGLSAIPDVVAKHAHLNKLHPLTKELPGLVSTSSQVTHAADLVIGLLLIMISHGLRRRKRRAWQAASLLLAFSVVIHLVHSPYLIPGLTAAVALAVLLYFHDDFYAVGDRTTRWRAVGVLLCLVAGDVAIGLSYIMLARHLRRNYPMPSRVVDVVLGLVGVSPSQSPFTDDRAAHFFSVLTPTLGVLTLLVGGYLFFRSARQHSKPVKGDADQIRGLLGEHGDRDSLGYFALRDDKSVIWSPTGKSCIGYRVVSGVMLASGDPIGDPEAWPGAMRAFLDEAERHAWVPAVMGCSELGAQVWCREADLTALEIGDEAVVDVASFSMDGRHMRNVRQMVTRVARNGYTAQIRRVADIPREEIDRFIRQADDWRDSSTERGFSMALGRLGRPADGECVIATATENGVLRGMLQFVPWGPDGLSLDLMRREHTAQPGVNDFLIVETIKQAGDLGIKRMSLNFAVFRSALARGEKIGAGPVMRAWRAILVFMSRWFQIESLYKFNEKFCPAWVPRYFVFPGAKDVPRIGLAALEAEAFLVWPTLPLGRLARRLHPRRLARRLRRARAIRA